MVMATGRRHVAAVLLSALLAAACGSDGGPQGTNGDGGVGDGIRVVATTSSLGEVVATLVGEDGHVDVLMEPGVDPHAFAPSAAQAVALRQADLVVANGLGLEEGLLDALDAAVGDGATVWELGPLVDPVPLAQDAAGHDDDGEADDHDHGPLDPHVWLDPVRMARGVELLAQELATADDRLDDGEWLARGRTYAQQLLDLDAEARATLGVLPPERRNLVTNHDALGYLAARYDLTIIGTVIPGTSTQVDVSAGAFADLVTLLREMGARAIFAETTAPDALARALADEVGDVEVVLLHTGALGGPGSGAETYLDLLAFNVQAIADALR